MFTGRRKKLCLARPTTGGYTILRHDNVRDFMDESFSYARLQGIETGKVLLPVLDVIQLHASANYNTTPD